MDKQFTEFVHNKFMSVTSWLVLINGRLFKALEDSDKNLDTIVAKRSAILIDGIELCQAIKRKVKQVLLMHTAFKTPMDKPLINGVIQCIEMMKAMEESYNK